MLRNTSSLVFFLGLVLGTFGLNLLLVVLGCISKSISVGTSLFGLSEMSGPTANKIYRYTSVLRPLYARILESVWFRDNQTPFCNPLARAYNGRILDQNHRDNGAEYVRYHGDSGE